MSTTRVVQFPHPGPERHPTPLEVGAQLPWNTGRHGRKFLLSPAQWLGPDGEPRSGDVVFWGEWEPPSRVVELTGTTSKTLPRAVQEPFVEAPAPGWRQNTDPLVFGERFVYTNCRQQQNGKLRDLGEGSVVLFGSSLAGAFVLDTVLVVSHAQPYRPIDGPPTPDLAGEVLITEPLAKGEGADAGNVWYTGATAADPVDGMFSFVPALPHATGRDGFERPAIRLDGFVHPNLAQQARCTEVSLPEARTVWDAVADKVRGAGLVLAHSLPLPPGITATTPPVSPAGNRPGRC